MEKEDCKVNFSLQGIIEECERWQPVEVNIYRKTKFFNKTLKN